MISRNELQALPLSQAATHLTNLDLIASTILQIVYSGSQAPSKATQGMIQQKTVAAALSPDKSHHLYLADSGQLNSAGRLDPRAGGRFARNLGTDLISGTPFGDELLNIGVRTLFVFIPVGDVHAEVRLVVGMASLGVRAPTAVGVSKGCCSECQKFLNARGITYSTFHDDPVNLDRSRVPEPSAELARHFPIEVLRSTARG